MIGSRIASIICGAPDGSLDKRLVEGMVVCADSGLDHALAAGIAPDIVVGDFDSSALAVPAGIECIRVDPIKDDTDTILAADTAISRGCTELRFFCALGGRLDHAIANVQMLEHLREKGVSAVLYGGGESVRLLGAGESVKLDRHGGFVSVFALTETAVVTETGMKYELDRYPLKRSFPLGVSNEIAAECGVISVYDGLVMVYEVKPE